MKKVRLIKQLDEKDCGAACLSMILEFYERKFSLASIKEDIKVDQYGANIYGLLDGAKKHGLKGTAYSGESNALWEAMEQNEVIFPAIIRIVNRFGFEHYIVVTGMKKGKLFVCDPGEGNYKLSKEMFEKCYLGQIVIFEKTEDFLPENKKQVSLFKFTNIILRQKKLLAVIGVLSLLITAIAFLGTLLFQYLIDDVLTTLSDYNTMENTIETLVVLITALSVLYLFKLIIQILRGKLLVNMSKNIDLPLMLGYYDYVTELPMNFFDTRKTGEIMSRFNDASKIREAISGVTLTLMIDVSLVVICGIILHKKSPVLFMVAFGIFLIYVLISIFYMKPLDKFNRDVMEQDAQFNSYLKETIDGMETVKISQAESNVKSKVHELFIKFLNRNINGNMMALSKDALIDFTTSVGTLLLLWIGAIEVINGKMTIGSLVTFYLLLNYFLEPIQNLVGIQDSLQTALVAADRLNDVLELKPEKSGHFELNTSIETIDFKNISFRYGNRDLIIKDLSFSIKKGDKIAFVGESGCGKSTITKLLTGLYKPESGSIQINQKNIEAYSIKSLRTNIAYVPQTIFLFSDTIKNNLTLGLEQDSIPSDKKIKEVLNMCCCDFVNEMPFGLDSILEENGANLSGGQKQKLAIARALLRNPQVLILDEATSALDTIAERRIQTALNQFYPEMTMIIIAHRLSTVKECNDILVMNHGTLMEKGTHLSLIQNQGQYAELWNKQNSTF